MPAKKITLEKTVFAGDAKMQQAAAADGINIPVGSGPAMAFIEKGSPIKAVEVVGGAQSGAVKPLFVIHSPTVSRIVSWISCVGGPVARPTERLTFVTGLRTITTAGDADTRTGMAAHLLLAAASMVDEDFVDADGELLFVATRRTQSAYVWSREQMRLLQCRWRAAA